MGVEFECPGCGAACLAEEDEIGSQVTCPGCESIIIVPSESVLPSLDPVDQIRVRPDKVTVSTTGMPESARIIGPVNIVLGSRGKMIEHLEELKTLHAHKLAMHKRQGQISPLQELVKH